MPSKLNRKTVAYATSLAAELSRRRREIALKTGKMPSSFGTAAAPGSKKNTSNEVIVIDSDDEDSGSDDGKSTGDDTADGAPSPVIDSSLLSAIPMPSSDTKSVYVSDISPDAIPLPGEIKILPSDSSSNTDTDKLLLCPLDIPIPEPVEATVSCPMSSSLPESSSLLIPLPGQIDCLLPGSLPGGLSSQRLTDPLQFSQSKVQAHASDSTAKAAPFIMESLSMVIKGKAVEDEEVNIKHSTLKTEDVSLIESSNISASRRSSPQVTSSPLTTSPSVPIDTKPLVCVQEVKSSQLTMVANQETTSPLSPEYKLVANVQSATSSARRRLTDLPMPPGVYEEESESAVEDNRYSYILFILCNYHCVL